MTSNAVCELRMGLTSLYDKNIEPGQSVCGCAASGNDWQKDRQFHALNAVADLVEVKALRGGHECLVTNTDVVVGDILLLDTGDRVVADGIAVETHGLTIDEVRAHVRVFQSLVYARPSLMCVSAGAHVSHSGQAGRRLVW